MINTLHQHQERLPQTVKRITFFHPMSYNIFHYIIVTLLAHPLAPLASPPATCMPYLYTHSRYLPGRNYAIYNPNPNPVMQFCKRYAKF